MNTLKTLSLVLATTIVLAPTTWASPSHSAPKATITQAQMMETKSNAFKGAEVNGGTATVITKDGKTIVRLSSDFKIPASPSPHFQIVDADGNVFLLRRLTIAGNKTHRDAEIPAYIKSVAKVQIWCSFAEVVLGEATFDTVVMTSAK